MAKELMTGNQAAIAGAIAGGAQMMTGYPITPTTEMLHYWALEVVQNPQLKMLQTEDEMAAGFAALGGCLAGLKTFSATAGPGNILMQDAFSMAENMRLPIVAFINQRGGPSTGTVIYSQQELNLTCFGGNGEGLRIVYSASSVQEMYHLAMKTLQTAWKYRFPTFLLSDGYLAKTLTEIEIYSAEEKNIEIINPEAYLIDGRQQKGHFTNLRNTYNLEEELFRLLEKHQAAFQLAQPEIIEYEDYHTLDAEIVIFAHGVVAAAAREAVDILRQDNLKVGLFRPITLNPFPKQNAKEIAANKKMIFVAESSLGQFERIIKTNFYGLQTPIKSLLKPAMGINPSEIVEAIKSWSKEARQ